MKWRIIISAFLAMHLFLCINLEAQEPDAVQRAIEFIAENTEEEEVDFSEIAYALRNLLDYPVNINSEKIKILSNLYLLNDFQINNLYLYISEYGRLLSIYELLAVNGFDKNTLETIAPFIRAKEVRAPEKEKLAGIFKYPHQEILLRYTRLLEKKEGFKRNDSIWQEEPNKYYCGSPDKFYLRYKLNFQDRIKAGFLAEKDPGEVTFTKNLPDTIRQLIDHTARPVFDFYSGYMQLENIYNIRSLVIGDYQLGFGQGLTLWTGLGFGKSPSAINIKKFGYGVKANHSSNESGFFRGAAGSFQLGKFDITAFYSSLKRDANVMVFDSALAEIAEVSSLQTSGYHRTVNELEDKNVLGNKVFGGNISFNTRRFHIGATAYKSSFAAHINPAEKLYNKYYFRGKELAVAGMDFNWLMRDVNFFGEISYSSNNAKAILLGALINVQSRVNLAVLYRNYDKNYQNLFGNALGENSRNMNESGIYMGMQTQLSKSFSFSAYCDLFEFPWLRFRTDAPSQGRDYYFQADYIPNNNVSMYARFRYKEKSENASAEAYMHEIHPYQKNSLRYHIEYNLNHLLTLRNRIEYSCYKMQDENSKGYLIYQDIVYTGPDERLRVYFRYALFDSDSYNSRIYVYENDLLYAFSIPAFYERGIRSYILFNYKLRKNISFWLKLARLQYTNLDEIGSGKDLIDGNHKTDIRLQLRIKL